MQETNSESACGIAYERKSMSYEREWADDELTAKSAKQLAEYLSATPSTAWEIAVWCSDTNISKVFEFALEAVRSEPLDSAVDVVGAVIRGLSSRFREEGFPD